MSSKTNYFDFSAVQLHQLYRSKEVSPVHVMQSVIEQIQRLEPQLCATYLFRPEAALAAAKLSEQRFMQGSPCGLLDGIAVTIKENIATQGDPLPMGSAAVKAAIATSHAPPAARLHEAGAIMVSKTTMPDFGMLSSGLSSFHHLSRNPWDTSKGPGGSSAGAGAAAAAGYGPLHIGTDIGGSVRLPANWCGVFTLKPSLGRIPIDPPYMGRAAGPMTRSVADSAFMMQVLSLPDARDSMSLPSYPIDWSLPSNEQLLTWLKGKKIGLLQDAGCGAKLDPQILLVVEQAAASLAAHGAIVEPMQPFMNETMLRGLDYFWRMRSMLDLDALPNEQRERCLPFIVQWAQGARSMTGPEVFQAASQSHATRVATVAACNQYDFVLSPVAPNLPFKAENASPANDPLRALEHIGFTVPYNMSEQPAASVNWGYAVNDNQREVPVGVQIAGARADDRGVLLMSRIIEILRPAQRPWPSLARA